MADSKSEGGTRRRIRRLIIGRSVVVGLLGSVPVPQVEDSLRASVRRSLLQRLASLRQVDIEDDALQTLVADSANQQRLDTVFAIGNLLAALRQTRRRALVGFLSLRRFDQALRTYEQAYLFDHYCSRHHLGPGIDEPQAKRLRADFDRAAQETHRDLARSVVESLAGGTWQALGAAAGRVGAALKERRLAAAPELLSSAASALSSAVSGARSRALTSLRKEGPAAILGPLTRGLERYSDRLAAAYDRRAGRGARDSNQGGDA